MSNADNGGSSAIAVEWSRNETAPSRRDECCACCRHRNYLRCVTKTWVVVPAWLGELDQFRTGSVCTSTEQGAQGWRSWWFELSLAEDVSLGLQSGCSTLSTSLVQCGTGQWVSLSLELWAWAVSVVSRAWAGTRAVLPSHRPCMDLQCLLELLGILEPHIKGHW